MTAVQNTKNHRDTPRRRVVLVFGTRPEVIKLAPVARALSKYESDIETLLCSTGQHRELLDQALLDVGLHSDIDLHLMTERQPLATLFARAIVGVDRTLRSLGPDYVVVQGDTTSAVAAAFAAYLLRIPVGHVEAGLRSNDQYEPFPEEANRRIISQLATLHFAPTKASDAALAGESLPSPRIYLTGNTVIDSLLWVRERLKSRAPEPARHQKTVLVTLHRRVSSGECLEDVCRAIMAMVVSRPHVQVLFPVHPSPAVREPVHAILGGHPRIDLCEPLSYRELVAALDRCHFVLTDSGGLQEEAPTLGKPVLVVRNVTERREGILAGTAALVGTEPQTILRAALILLDDDSTYARMAQARNPYGDGHAGARIATILANELGAIPLGPQAPSRRQRVAASLRFESR